MLQYVKKKSLITTMEIDNSHNILIVDDKPENLLTLRAILEDLPVNIISTTSSKDALILLLQHEFALVILDVLMPEMSGFEVGQLMKRYEKTKYIPIIYITALKDGQEYKFKGYEVGAVDYLIKPVDPLILRNKVKVFLSLYMQRKELVVLTQRLAKSEEKYRKLIETTIDAVFITDTDTGVIIDANQQAENMIGFPKEKIIGMHQENLYLVNEKERYEQMLMDIVEGKKHIHSALSVVHRSGRSKSVDVYSSVFELDGKMVMASFFRDTTETKETKEALIKKNTYLENILNTFTDMAIIAADLNFNILYYNPIAESMFGCTIKCLKELKLTDIYNIINSSNIDFNKAIEILKKNAVYTFTVEYKQEQSHHLLINAKLTAIRDNNNKMAGYLLICNEITPHITQKNSLDK
ncbi:MAG: PAS domain S-box protein [Candidatus Magnetoovum sp. WYHC-5]|nr:PAS domain S-box protein [Candidatus Magnetoovum sp. WYHC-5]